MDLFFRFSRTPWLTASSGLILALILALTLSLFGWFFPPLTLLALILLFGGVGFALFSLFQAKDLTRLTLIGLLSLLALVIALRTEPSVFTGRDQGSISLAALELSTNYELAFRSPVSDAFFEIYGPGRALNFPGFSYTESGALITQFPLGYTSYLALFSSWFGVSGLVLGNALLFILSGWTFFELLSLFVTRKSALFGTALFVTSFLPIWLMTLTLTENLALLLYLTIAKALVRLDQDDDPRFLPLIILTGFLLALTRIEGFVIAGIMLAFIILRPKLRAHLLALPKRFAIPAILFLGFLFLRDLFMNLPFYTMIGKAALKYWHELSGTGGGGSNPAIGPILFSYGLFPIFLLGIASLLFGLMKRKFTLLIPVLLAAPTLLYLLNGHISDDHPWLLRRYAFTIFPLLLLATVCLIENLKGHLAGTWQQRFSLAAFAALFLLQLSPAFAAFKTVEYDTLLDQTKTLSQFFTEKDLVLIDRGTTGDPFALLAGPLATLYGKNAVYFFNPDDYDRLDRSGFDRVYLLTAEDSLGRYADTFGDRLLPVQTVSFTFPALAAKIPYAAPEENRIESNALIFQITE